MRTIRHLAVFALLAALPLLSQAEMFRCKLPDGTTAYQDGPCEENAKQQVLRVDKRGVLKVAPDAPADTSRTESDPKVSAGPARVAPPGAAADTANASATPAADSAHKPDSAIQDGRAGGLLLIFVFLIIAVTHIWILIRIWRISTIGGILFLFFWPISIYFLIANWHDEDNIKTPFVVNFLAWILFIVLTALIAKPAYDDYLKKQKEAASHVHVAPPGAEPAR